MTKPNSSTKRNSDSSTTERWLLICTNIVSKIGVPGFIAISFITYIFLFTDKQRKNELTDRWLLFKNNSNIAELCISIVVFAVFIYFLEAYAFYRIRKLDQDEIARLSEFKKLYQQQELGKTLPGSEKKSKL